MKRMIYKKDIYNALFKRCIKVVGPFEDFQLVEGTNRKCYMLRIKGTVVLKVNTYDVLRECVDKKELKEYVKRLITKKFVKDILDDMELDHIVYGQMRPALLDRNEHDMTDLTFNTKYGKAAFLCTTELGNEYYATEKMLMRCIKEVSKEMLVDKAIELTYGNTLDDFGMSPVLLCEEFEAYSRVNDFIEDNVEVDKTGLVNEYMSSKSSDYEHEIYLISCRNDVPVCMMYSRKYAALFVKPEALKCMCGVLDCKEITIACIGEFMYAFKGALSNKVANDVRYLIRVALENNEEDVMDNLVIYNARSNSIVLD